MAGFPVGREGIREWRKTPRNANSYFIATLSLLLQAVLLDLAEQRFVSNRKSFGGLCLVPFRLACWEILAGSTNTIARNSLQRESQKDRTLPGLPALVAAAEKQGSDPLGNFRSLHT